MLNENSFTDQKPRYATEEDFKLNWGGDTTGKNFRCCMCGYKFKLQDYWRFVFSDKYSNFIVCSVCDGDDVLERWHSLNTEIKNKFWWVLKLYNEKELVEMFKTYRKKPVEVLAVRLTKQNIKQVYYELCGSNIYPELSKNEEVIVIPTFEGRMVAMIGNWIIKGVAGEYYPCKDDIFRATYEEVSND